MSLGWYLLILPPYLYILLIDYLSKRFLLPTAITIPISLLVIQIPIFFHVLKDEIEDYLRKEQSIFNSAYFRLEKERSDQNKKIELERQKMAQMEERMRVVLSTKQPFKVVAGMRTAAEMIVFDQAYQYLKHKPHPAATAAETVRRYKNLAEKIQRETLEIKYKYDYILAVFPEIAEYVNNDEDLISVGEHLSYKDLEKIKDRRKDYLSLEEYNKLSETEKSQLALNRYIQCRSKSRWQIGRDYEMSCAHQLRESGYSVELTGIKYKTEDLGRDLIAVKDKGDEIEILIVQCKNWSQERTIHENVIMQLFGTTVLYAVNNKIRYSQIIPVLMIPPHGQLSEIALKVSKELNIRIMRIQNIEFPRIKCNINNGNKIYHLPFDQQYDRTEIKLPGECYAYTVAEAECKGFRRAMKHLYN